MTTVTHFQVDLENARLNDDRRAGAVGFVPPRDEPPELAARIQQWIDDYRPADSVERELVARAAGLAWDLDQARRGEAALMAEYIRISILRLRADRIEAVRELGRKLFYLAGSRSRHDPGPAWSDQPAVFVARLEETPEGARWLRDRWLEMRSLMASEADWGPSDQFRFVRLLGRRPADAIDDPKLNAVFLAWETLKEGWGLKFWQRMRDATPSVDPAFNDLRAWRAVAPRPESPQAAAAMLAAVVDDAIDRLDGLIAALEQLEDAEAREPAARASFLASPAGERLRRCQTARARELHQTLELLAKLRSKPKKAENPPAAVPPPEPAPPPSEPSPMGRKPRRRSTPKFSTDPRTRARGPAANLRTLRRGRGEVDDRFFVPASRASRKDRRNAIFPLYSPWEKRPGGRALRPRITEGLRNGAAARAPFSFLAHRTGRDDRRRPG